MVGVGAFLIGAVTYANAKRAARMTARAALLSDWEQINRSFIDSERLRDLYSAGAIPQGVADLRLLDTLIYLYLNLGDHTLEAGNNGVISKKKARAEIDAIALDLGPFLSRACSLVDHPSFSSQLRTMLIKLDKRTDAQP
jgi:hypothetical protein